ncbi:MAG: hypoxanthine-guanine phosphoribosyltransferase [Zoogloeaceae bacterium]|jgi:hypoxanthine phosphoribosyltransferase|nr:hypoxanthine-guanine phosphoribosyltransferase [Zoogloeaceae bacterium]
MNLENARAVLQDAELIHSADAVQRAIDSVAERIRQDLSGLYPVILAVMSGAVPFVGHLLPRLDFPLDFDYLHASRYGLETQSKSALTWRSGPWIALKERHVLVVDDILDEGVTLSTICARLKQMGAASVRAAVLVEKNTGKTKPLIADYVGLVVPDRFVFGFGMDICGMWRNLPAIYARA